jgi:hypothetical protein
LETKLNYELSETNESTNLDESLLAKKSFLLPSNQVSIEFDSINLNDTYGSNREFFYTMKLSDTQEENNGIVDKDRACRCEDNSILEKTFANDLINAEDLIYDNCIRIIKYLSEGGQAKIYLGLIEEIEKIVAIKRYTINHSEQEMNRIIEECDTVKSLDHPNIVKYFDVETTNINCSEAYNQNYLSRIDIIMEYIDGMNIKEYLNKNKISTDLGIPLSDIKLIVTKILEGLEYLHHNKIIHRDLKVNYI